MPYNHIIAATVMYVKLFSIHTSALRSPSAVAELLVINNRTGLYAWASQQKLLDLRNGCSGCNSSDGK